MSKKVFTLLLLAVFVLAQFSLASAAPAPVLATGTATAIVDTFTNDRVFGGNPDINVTYTWKTANLTTYPFSKVILWGRIKATPANLYTCLWTSPTLTTANGNGSFSDATTPPGTPVDMTLLGALTPAQGQDVQFVATIDDASGAASLVPAACAGTEEQPGVLAAASDTTTYDNIAPKGYIAGPPAADPAAGAPLAGCNTFNLYGLVNDLDYADTTIDWSGVDSFNQFSTITSAPSNEFTVALGADWMSLAFNAVIPSTATFASWAASPSDFAGNETAINTYYVSAAPTTAGEKANCKSFSDTAGTDSESIARYMADIELIGGYADGTFGPDNILTRAELATLIEISNGYTAGTLPTAAPAGCTFSDVAATDWFSGWIWQACDDEFLAGYADGSYGPNDTLTRAHVVTALNNVFFTTVTLAGHFNPAFYATVLESQWAAPLRVPSTLTWEFSDVADATAYYYDAAYSAYGSGIADATDVDQTTFSPDAPVTRAEFVTMLYRALSMYNAVP